MRYLVTGGAGFLGSHVVDRLVAEGHDVDAVDDLSRGHLANLAEARAAGRVRFHHLDVRAPELFDLVERLRPDAVLHLVGPGHPTDATEDPLYAADVGVLGLLNLLEAVRALPPDTRVVVALPLWAVAAGPPPGPHAALCRAMREVTAGCATVHRLNVVTVALATVYGPRQRGGLVDELVRAGLEGRAARLEGPPAARDLLYVDDAVDALVRASGGRPPSGQTVVVTTGQPVELDELRRLVSAVTGRSVEVTQVPARAGDSAPPPVAPDEGARALGWAPFTSLADGVAQTVAHAVEG